MFSTDLNNTVFIKRCEAYDREHLKEIISDGMTRFGFRPQGRVMVKPNAVFACNTNTFGDTAYTSPRLSGHLWSRCQSHRA